MMSGSWWEAKMPASLVGSHSADSAENTDWKDLDAARGRTAAPRHRSMITYSLVSMM
jgi:hypothetical protein